MRFAASPRCVPPAACPQRRSRPAPAAQRLPARCAAAGGGGDAKKGSWPSADELRRASSGAPDAAKHFDVTGVVVAPSFRASRSFLAAKDEAAARSTDPGPVRVLLLSEGNVCRSVLAEAMLAQRLQERGLGAVVRVESKGTRDYNAGEAPEPATAAVAQALGLALRPDFAARHSDVAADVVLFDVLLPVDKFTAADVMREVTVYDTIEPQANYSAKVHALATFHAGGRIDEIDDPLYGSTDRGGADEIAAVTAAATVLASCCEGLANAIASAAESAGVNKGAGPEASPALRAELRSRLTGMDPMVWLRPPMLSPRN